MIRPIHAKYENARRLSAFLAVMMLLLGGTALAAPQTPDTRPAISARDSLRSFTPNTNSTFSIHKAGGPVQIDGQLTEPVWRTATRIDNFSEVSPGDNTEPAVRTEALFTYDDDNFYVAFICHDVSARAIRASICDRDNIFQDDCAGVILDTFLDRQNAYEFIVNAHGIQGDLRRNFNNEDSSFDTVWESAAHINDAGWTAEMAIPFRSIRFPDTREQEWGIHVLRIRPRDSREQHSWLPVDRDDSCFMCQAGTMRGITGVNTGKNLEILPYTIASQSGSLNDGDDPHSGFDNQDIDIDGGLGIKYGITPNLTMDVTYNPDFSQIESDAAQVDVNTTFALFFQEKRPFFLEGADIFDSNIDVIYTRSINDPLAAAKLTGKIGKYTIGYIFAADEHSPLIVPFEDWSEIALAGESTVNILRIKRDLLSDSNVGLLFSDRRVSGGSNSVLGLDGTIRFLENYRVQGQALYSYTEEPDDPELSADFADTTFGKDGNTSVFDGETFDGTALSLRFARNARHWEFTLGYDDLSPSFRADNGIVTRNNYRFGSFWTGLTFRPDNAVLDVIQPQFNYGIKNNYDGAFKDTWYSPSVWVRFKKQITLFASYVWSEERFKDVLVEGISRFEGEIDINTLNTVSGGAHARVGRSVARSEDPPLLGVERTYDVWTTFKPTPRLMLDATYTFAKMLERPDGPELYRGYIARTRFTYQFTRRLFLRLVTQYNDFNDQVEIDPLLSYKINPFTVFFVGSSHRLENFGGDVDYRQTERQFFVKFQYLFRI